MNIFCTYISCMLFLASFSILVWAIKCVLEKAKAENEFHLDRKIPVCFRSTGILNFEESSSLVWRVTSTTSTPGFPLASVSPVLMNFMLFIYRLRDMREERYHSPAALLDLSLCGDSYVMPRDLNLGSYTGWNVHFYQMSCLLLKYILESINQFFGFFRSLCVVKGDEVALWCGGNTIFYWGAGKLGKYISQIKLYT